MSLATNVSDLATAVATEVKRNRTWINGNAADLTALTTTAQGNLVAAVNEVAASVGAAAGIDDGTTSTSSTWSSQKTSDEIDAAVGAIDVPVLTDLIDDVTPSTSTVYSSTKTNTAISTAVAAIDLTDLIDDVTPGTDTVYSSTMTDSQIAAAKDEILGGADAAYDTLVELQGLLEADDTLISGLTTSVGNRVRFDAVQSLTSPQQTQARSNIGAAAASDLTTLTSNVGTTTTDFAAVFAAGLT